MLYIILGNIYLYRLGFYVFILVIFGILVVGSVLSIDSMWTDGICFLCIQTWVIITPVVVDCLFTILTTILFTKPLQKLIAGTNEADTDIKEQSIKISRLITKLILLTSISIATNIIGGVFFAITDIALLTYLDTVINPICMVCKTHILYICLSDLSKTINIAINGKRSLRYISLFLFLLSH